MSEIHGVSVKRLILRGLKRARGARVNDVLHKYKKRAVDGRRFLMNSSPMFPPFRLDLLYSSRRSREGQGERSRLAERG